MATSSNRTAPVTTSCRLSSAGAALQAAVKGYGVHCTPTQFSDVLLPERLVPFLVGVCCVTPLHGRNRKVSTGVMANLRLIHWQVKSYARHTASDDLMNELGA
jgi:hypothetical protein